MTGSFVISVLADPFFQALWAFCFALLCFYRAWELSRLQRQGGVGTVGRRRRSHR